MQNKNYYVGLDIGTDSVGYAVTDEQYNLCKFKGEPMWGVTLFEEAELAVARRGFRVARRRLDRRQQRVDLIQELFAREIAKVDADFYRRIRESYLYPETSDQKVRLFRTYAEQSAYTKKYPTIHHLIDDLMKSNEEHDVRLVYIACAWLVAHRGHFLSEVDKRKVSDVTDFSFVYKKLADFIKRDGRALPWNKDVDLDQLQNVLKAKINMSKKVKALTDALFASGKAPKEVCEEYEFNYQLVVKLLAGGEVAIKDLFDNDEYADLDIKKVALNMNDEALAAVLQSLGDDAELIIVLKSVYDWSVLVDILKGNATISEAKVAVYDQHKNDLKLLKTIVRKYAPAKYNALFRDPTIKNNYVSYVGKNQTNNDDVKVKKTTSKEDFHKYALSVVKSITPDERDKSNLENMISRLEVNDFLPKQVDGDNRVIPYQLYWYELNEILKKAKSYIPFLSKTDEDGITGAEKILSVFEFRVPYYVGPLKTSSNPKWNHWMVRKAEGKILPWNFDKMVDLDRSEDAFIDRMTNSCTYLSGEDVLPKNSLIYCAFEVLNEINNIKINGNDIPVEVKQSIYNNVFTLHDKVNPKQIKNHLVSNNFITDSDIISGLDITVKSSLKPYRCFARLFEKKLLDYKDAEAIIKRSTYSEDKLRFREWLKKEYSHLPDDEVKYISGLKFKDFGRLSAKFLCGIEGIDTGSGEVYSSIIRAMWETNLNLMQLLSDRFTFKNSVDELVKEYYGVESMSLAERLDKMYVSNAVKRPIIRTLDVLKDVVKVNKCEPTKIFVEMARGANEDQKGKRTVTRLQQLRDLYSKVKDQDVKDMNDMLDSLGDLAHNKLQSDKLFLYFIQLGKCLYTGKSIDIESVISGDGTYNVEHIYPRSFVKDDSVINNKILVDSKANGEKSDNYPIDAAIREKMLDYWTRLNKIGLISDEKFKRLTRSTCFTSDEKYEFINRQLVETRQSTKVVASLLKELYPSTEIVYVKAGLVSEFRQEFDVLKSRAVNDLHHAKDAYLNIVVGNVWHSKFNRRFWNADEKYSIKPEIVFTRPVVCNGKTVWNGAVDKERVVKNVRKNTAHMTKYSFCRKGGFFDQMPLSSAEGLIPRKQNMPTEIYGGYNKSTASFFTLVRYNVAKKYDVMVMPVELIYADQFLRDDRFATEYAKKTIGDIINKEVLEVKFLLNKRVLKVNTMLSLNGLRVCITGKSGGGKQLGVSVMEAFKISVENETYVKRLESFKNKKSKNAGIVYNELHDGINKDRNLAMFDCYIEKLQKAPYNCRPANPLAALSSGREKFVSLSCEAQVDILLDVLGLFGRAPSADLTSIGGASKAGVAMLSSTLSNWKNNYTDVRIVDQSASGLFESVSENLLDLL